MCLCAKAVVGSNGVQKIVPHILKQESQVIVIRPVYLGIECGFLSRAAQMKNPGINSCTRKAQTPVWSKGIFYTTYIPGVYTQLEDFIIITFFSSCHMTIWCLDPLCFNCQNKSLCFMQSHETLSWHFNNI